MEPRKLLSRLRRRIGRLEVLAGSNADEGTKALMYFSPYLFPNREIESAALSRHDFSSTVERIFAHLSKQVRNLSIEILQMLDDSLSGPNGRTYRAFELEMQSTTVDNLCCNVKLGSTSEAKPSYGLLHRGGLRVA